jgi:hypothetical protein
MQGPAKVREFHAYKACECNIQNGTIPVVQLTQAQKLSTQNFKGTVILRSVQQCQALQYEVVA